MIRRASGGSGGGGTSTSTPPPDPEPEPGPDPGDILAADNFNRADGALGVSSSGHTWTHTGWTVASNVCVPPNSGGRSVATMDAGELLDDPTAAENVVIEVTVDPNELPDLGVIFRRNGADWGLAEVGAEGDHWLCRVHQFVSGGFITPLTPLVNPITVLGTDQTTPFTIRVEVNGSNGELFVNDESQGSWTGTLDSALLHSTEHGLFGNDVTSSVFDNITITLF